MNKWVRLFLLILAVGNVAWAESIAPSVPIGTTIAGVTFEDIRYVTRNLKDFGEKKAIVFVFTSTGCPLAQRYIPRLNELSNAYADKNVQFVGINSTPDDSIKEMAYYAMEYEVAFPVVKDLTGAAAKTLGATCTPEVVVLDGSHAIRYRGRIDDQYRITGSQPSPTRDDLRLAIDDLLAGREVAVKETPPEGCTLTLPETPKPTEPITFSKHVAPIVYKNCTPCHHDGSETPFSLDSYEAVSGKAKMISKVVTEERMPPWFAHPDFGSWVNARGLTGDEKRVIAQWVEGGKLPGNAGEQPTPPVFDNSQWLIGQPDLILTAAEPYQIPADGIVDYQYVTMPYKFPEDTWVQGIQIQPKNTRVVHHANVVYVTPGKSYVEDESFLTGRVPGGSPAKLSDGVAMLIPKDAVLVVQIHYVTTGKPETDQMSIGLRYAKETIRKRARHKVITNKKFSIPAGAGACTISAAKTIEDDGTMVALFVHMHLRGKNSTFYAKYPDGNVEKMLVIPNYSFDWQMPYLVEQGTKKLPKGTTIECVSQFDNSAFNPFNPDPAATVEHGPQTFHEMMDGYIFYTVDNEDLNLHVDPATGQVAQVKTALR